MRVFSRLLSEALSTSSQHCARFLAQTDRCIAATPNHNDLPMCHLKRQFRVNATKWNINMKHKCRTLFTVACLLCLLRELQKRFLYLAWRIIITFSKKSTTATAVNHLYPRYNTTYVTRPISKVTERWFSIDRDLFVRARWTRAPQLVCLNNRE